MEFYGSFSVLYSQPLLEKKYFWKENIVGKRRGKGGEEGRARKGSKEARSLIQEQEKKTEICSGGGQGGRGGDRFSDNLNFCDDKPKIGIFIY